MSVEYISMIISNISDGQDSRREMLDMTRLADRHGWVHTIHSAQGATSDRVLVHVQSFRANIVDARAIYLAISRARKVAPSTPTAAPAPSTKP